MSWNHAWRLFAATAGAAAALACGSAEPVEDAKERASWSAPAEKGAAEDGSNAAPVIYQVSLTPTEPGPGDRVKAIVDAKDADGDRLELSYVWRIGGDIQPANGQDMMLGELMPGETVSVEVIASDGETASPASTATVRVRNSRPVITKVTLQPGASVSKGDPVTALAEARDPDGSPLTYEYTWLVNGRPESSGATLDTEPLDVGDRVQVSVVASDGEDESDPILTAEIQIANGRPQILSSPTAALDDGEFHYRVEARDPDGSRSLRYHLKQAPKGMTISSVRGDVRWRPGPDQAGTHPIEIVVEDPDGGRTSQTFELTITSETQQPVAAPAD